MEKPVEIFSKAFYAAAVCMIKTIDRRSENTQPVVLTRIVVIKGEL